MHQANHPQGNVAVANSMVATNDNDDDDGRVVVLSVASLRRTSPLQQQQQPTRTLQISEAEHAAAERQASPVVGRPRSNPRRRCHSRGSTPPVVVRYESPLEPDAFRRESILKAEQQQQQQQQSNAVVGVILPRRIEEEQRPATPKSRKQGPSHRKIRRWNNEHFDGLAAEIAASSAAAGGRGGGGGCAAAHALLKAKQDAHLYRSIIDFNTHAARSEELSSFMKDSGGQMKLLRDRFFEGELPLKQQHGGGGSKSNTVAAAPVTAQDRMHQIDSRLRRVVVKACCNSYPAAHVVSTFESFLLDSFISSSKKKKKQKKHNHDDAVEQQQQQQQRLQDDWWEALLLERPTCSRRKKNDDSCTAQFFFDGKSSTGGFHRLLLHAVSQFHGLTAISKMVDLQRTAVHDGRLLRRPGEMIQARALTVRGTMTSSECKFRLVDHIVSSVE